MRARTFSNETVLKTKSRGRQISPENELCADTPDRLEYAGTAPPTVAAAASTVGGGAGSDFALVGGGNGGGGGFRRAEHKALRGGHQLIPR